MDWNLRFRISQLITEPPACRVFSPKANFLWLTSTLCTWCVALRRADQLMAEDNDDAIPYCIATGDVKKLVSFFTDRGQLRQALIVAQVGRARTVDGTTRDSRTSEEHCGPFFWWIGSLFQGACEGNIRTPQTALVNHTTNDVDNRQQYQRYFYHTDALTLPPFCQSSWVRHRLNSGSHWLKDWSGLDLCPKQIGNQIAKTLWNDLGGPQNSERDPGATHGVLLLAIEWLMFVTVLLLKWSWRGFIFITLQCVW